MKRLPKEVKSLVAKARDAAMLAAETYNRPNASFRSHAYIVLMTVAWTSLFHAIFLQKRIKPFYRISGSRKFKKLDGDYQAWDLSECLRQHFGAATTGVSKNLDFFIGLRNKIEHRSYPQLDFDIFGECQAMLMNFEEMLCKEFGDKCALKTGLAFALQFSRCMEPTQAAAMSKNMLRQYRSVKAYVDTFRSSLSSDLRSDLTYSFKVFLIPKIGNHQGSADLAVEFVRYDPSKPEEMKSLEQVAALIKPKEVSVTNLGLIKATEVVRQVQRRLGKKFTMYSHILSFRHFNVRPRTIDKNPATCDTRYCVYDALHGDYGYRPEWVDFLVAKLSEPATYDFVLGKKPGAQAAKAPAQSSQLAAQAAAV